MKEERITLPRKGGRVKESEVFPKSRLKHRGTHHIFWVIFFGSEDMT